MQTDRESACKAPHGSLAFLDESVGVTQVGFTCSADNVHSTRPLRPLACLLLLSLLLLSQCTPQLRLSQPPGAAQGADQSAGSPAEQGSPNPSLTPEEQLELFNIHLNRA